MSMIIVPKQHRSDVQPFAEIAEDPAKVRSAMNQFTAILEQSYRHDASVYGAGFAKRHMTASESKRRADIMARWYRELRNSGYGHIQSMDEIPKALRAELDGGNYTPPERSRLWAPQGVQ